MQFSSKLLQHASPEVPSNPEDLVQMGLIRFAAKEDSPQGMEFDTPELPQNSNRQQVDSLCQGCPILLLEGNLPKEFSSDPNLNKLIKVSCITTNVQTDLFELNSIGQWASRSRIQHS